MLNIFFWGSSLSSANLRMLGYNLKKFFPTQIRIAFHPAHRFALLIFSAHMKVNYNFRMKR